MNWNRLMENRCPTCGHNLLYDPADYFRCSCGFKVSSRRFKQIVANQIDRSVANHYRPPDENASLS